MITGGEKVVAAQLRAEDDLLEHHSCTLFPALLKRAANGSDEAVPLERIENALQGSKFLAVDSDSPTAADICIGVDLLAYSDTSNLPESISSYLEVRCYNVLLSILWLSFPANILPYAACKEFSACPSTGSPL